MLICKEPWKSFSWRGGEGKEGKGTLNPFVRGRKNTLSTINPGENGLQTSFRQNGKEKKVISLLIYRGIKTPDQNPPYPKKEGELHRD